MNTDELSALSDEELEARIADSRPNSYVPSSVYHVYMAEQEKRKHQRILEAISKRRVVTSGRTRRRVPDPVIKRLFTEAQNRCAFPECATSLINSSGVNIAEIAHIEADSQGGPRYNENQSQAERLGYDNLLLLCPTHHSLIDRDVSTYTVELLKTFKQTQVSGGNDIVLELSYRANQRDGKYHEYTLLLTVTNNSGKSIRNPKLKITMSKDNIRATSSDAQKTQQGNLQVINFDKLDVSVIHPGERQKLLDTSNVGIIYFMNSDLHDRSDIMNASLKIELFADDFKPMTIIKPFQEMQQF